MGLQKYDKLNHLVRQLPEGVVVPSSWLNERNYSRQLSYKYVQHGWLEKIGHGLFILPGSVLNWKGVVLGLQTYAKLPFHIGGLTALTQQGYAQYLPLGNELFINLYGQSKIPRWLEMINLEQKFLVHTKKIFSDNIQDLGLTQIPSGIREMPLTISTIERAILEMISTTEFNHSNINHIAELFEGMTVLKPKLISQLLVSCERIKTKRLFLFLANYYQHPWLKRIDIDTIALGSGKIQFVENGKYDSEFMITVPEQYIVK